MELNGDIHRILEFLADLPYGVEPSSYLFRANMVSAGLFCDLVERPDFHGADIAAHELSRQADWLREKIYAIVTRVINRNRRPRSSTQQLVDGCAKGQYPGR